MYIISLRKCSFTSIHTCREREREMFYLTTHSTHFIYGYMASDIWLRTILIVREETRCRHIGYSYRLTARVLLYAPSQRQDNTYHGLCYTSRGALAGTNIHACIHTHSFTHTYINSNIHIFKHTYKHICMHTLIHTYIYIYTHMHTHTYIHASQCQVCQHDQVR